MKEEKIAKNSSQSQSDPFKDVPFHEWKVVTFSDGSQSICYSHGGSTIYDVPLWEMRTFNELAVWMEHLRDKNWFKQTGDQFWYALREAK